MLPKTSTYVKSYDRQDKLIYFLTESDELLEKYSTIWDTVLVSKNNLIASLSIIKLFENQNKILWFLLQKIPMVDFNYTFLAVIILDSALKKDENHYLQVFLKECKYIEKKLM